MTKNNLVSEVGSDFWKKNWDLTFGKIPVWYFLFSRVSHGVLLSGQAIRFVPMYD